MERKFDFKELDEEGLETLEAISDADKFNEWMYQSTSIHMSGSILEIGSGIGNISNCYINDNKIITLSDIRDNYCELLESCFGDSSCVQGVVNLDLVHPDFENIYSQYIESFDGVFALNVIEHIEDHQLAMVNAKKLLKKGGKLVILVPAYQSLYNRFDKELFHFRRYDLKTLRGLFLNSGLEIKKSYHFNFMGIPGWYISGKLQKNKTIPKGQMSLYNKFVPIFKIIDLLAFRSIGLSVVCVGEKK